MEKLVNVEDIQFYKDNETGRIGVCVPGNDRRGVNVIKWCPEEWIKNSTRPKGGSIVIHKLKNGESQIYEIDSIELGAEGQLGIVRLNSLSLKMQPQIEHIFIPSSMFDDLIDNKTLTIVNTE